MPAHFCNQIDSLSFEVAAGRGLPALLSDADGRARHSMCAEHNSGGRFATQMYTLILLPIRLRIRTFAAVGLPALTFPGRDSAPTIDAPPTAFLVWRFAAGVSAPERSRAAWISNTHLGTRRCHAAALLDFFETDFDARVHRGRPT